MHPNQKKNKIMEKTAKNQRKRLQKKIKEMEMAALVKGMAAQSIGGFGKKKKKKRPRKSRGAVSSQGEIVIRRRELLKEFKAGATETDLFAIVALEPSKFTWLKGLAKVFEKYQWLSLKFMWKPAVGTTVGGLVTTGIRWDKTEKTPAARTEIVAHTPNRTHAIWEDGEKFPLVIPADKLQTRKWYILAGKDADSGPGQLEVGVTSNATNSTLGELWVDYAVRMAGTQS